MTRDEADAMLEWLRESITALFQDDFSSAAIVATNLNGETITTYFQADTTQKAIFAHNIQADAMLDLVLANADMIREALEDMDEADAEQEDI